MGFLKSIVVCAIYQFCAALTENIAVRLLLLLSYRSFNSAANWQPIIELSKLQSSGQTDSLSWSVRVVCLDVHTWPLFRNCLNAVSFANRPSFTWWPVSQQAIPSNRGCGFHSWSIKISRGNWISGDVSTWKFLRVFSRVFRNFDIHGYEYIPCIFSGNFIFFWKTQFPNQLRKTQVVELSRHLLTLQIFSGFLSSIVKCLETCVLTFCVKVIIYGWGLDKFLWNFWRLLWLSCNLP